MHSSIRRGWSGAIMTIVVLSSWGCPGPRLTPDNAYKLPAPPWEPNRTTAALVGDAESRYVYGPERPQLATRDSEFKGPYVQTEDSLPRMWISTALLKDSTHRPPERIIARIRSEGAYPRAGIDSGYNYVARSTWRRDSTAAATWTTIIVSHDITRKPYLLTRDTRNQEYTHGDPLEPRLVRVQVHSVGFGACFDDPMCSSGHCGYY